jgi:LytS/YehU family sensor histidine kinase
VHADIDSSEMMIPSMLLQPILENCIEHGFKGIAYSGLIGIELNTEGPKLEIRIKDNGVGLNSGPKDASHVSRASQILHDRISLLNKKFKTQSAFVIQNNEDRGVCVIVTIPIIQSNEV